MAGTQFIPASNGSGGGSVTPQGYGLLQLSTWSNMPGDEAPYQNHRSRTIGYADLTGYDTYTFTGGWTSGSKNDGTYLRVQASNTTYDGTAGYLTDTMIMPNINEIVTISGPIPVEYRTAIYFWLVGGGGNGVSDPGFSTVRILFTKS